VTIDELSEYTFQATATDADLPPNPLTFSLVPVDVDHPVPAGASIDATSGVFTWTPSESQGPGTYTFKVRVSDGSLFDETTGTLTANEGTGVPMLGGVPASATTDEGTTLTFTATSTDADLPPNTPTFSLLNAPAGATIDPATGAFNWTPSEAQGPGT